MALAELPMLGPYTVTVDTAPSTAPGPSDALSDGSTATYVDVDQYIGPSGVFLNNVSGTLGDPPGATDTFPAIARAYARFNASGPIANVRLVVTGSGGSSTMDATAPTRDSPLGTLYPMDSNGVGIVHDALNGFTVTMYVDVPADREAHTVTRIYEAWIVVLIFAEAPPCRIYPREDGLGVGSGRAYPPPKSQQRSPGNRGVGYY